MKDATFVSMQIVLGYNSEVMVPDLGTYQMVKMCLPRSIVDGKIQKELLASEDVDNEENCVRLAEQLVREAFARYRSKRERTGNI